MGKTEAHIRLLCVAAAALILLLGTGCGSNAESAGTGSGAGTEAVLLNTGDPQGVAPETEAGNSPSEGGLSDESETAGAAGITETADPEHRGITSEEIALDWLLKHDLDPSAEELDLSGISVRGVDMDAVFAQCPQLKRVTMIDCGLTNRGYSVLQDKHPEIRIIWEIVLSHWTVRTDAVAFGTFKTTADTFFMDNEEAHYLRYCTDLVALDLGHNYVSNLSFLEYMPELKILILVDNVRLVDGDHLRHLTDLSELRYVPKLRYLEFFANNVSDFSFLQYLPELEDLNISYNSVYSIEYLTDLPNLKRLWMEHTNIPEYACAQLRQIYPYTQIVSEGEGSIDQGWRSGPRYSAMRHMLRENVIDEIYQ